MLVETEMLLQLITAVAAVVHQQLVLTQEQTQVTAEQVQHHLSLEPLSHALVVAVVELTQAQAELLQAVVEQVETQALAVQVTLEQ
jgi:hypothetical protein